MIKVTLVEEGFYVEQWCTSPTVYLDHWAWRRISESPNLAERFRVALKSCGGTLAFSWLNIIEFSKVTDEEQTRKADALLKEIWPNVFILYPNFFKVIEYENSMLTVGKPTSPPHADLVSLRAIVTLSLKKQNSLHLLPAPNLFSLSAATGITHDNFADSIVEHVESLRQDYCNNKEFNFVVNQTLKRKPTQYGTEFVARELLGSLLKYKNMQVDRNHAIDFSHVVVAVAYCEFVLLDGHWATQVESARRRLANAGMTFPIAKVFSERAGGLEAFLHELESL